MNNFEPPPFALWEHGKRIDQLYRFILNPLTINDLSKRIIRNRESIYRRIEHVDKANKAIKEAVGCV